MVCANFEIFGNKRNYCGKTDATFVWLYGIVKRTCLLIGRFDSSDLNPLSICPFDFIETPEILSVEKIMRFDE